MARILLVSFAGYPYTPSSLMPDNGLANLAGQLVDAGHDARVRDYGTVRTMSRLYPASIHRRMRPIVQRMLGGGKPKLREIATALRCDLRLRRHQRRVYRELADELLAEVDRFGADAIGFKLWNGDGFLGTTRLAEHIRRRRPDLKLLAGGPHVDWFRAAIFQHTRVFDALVRGEGEPAIVPLAEYVVGKRPRREVPNLLYLDAGRIRRTPQARAEQLDALAMPRYDADVYPSLHEDGQVRLMTIDESRGCPGRCAFCLHGRKSGKHWRFKCPERLVAEMRTIQATVGTRGFVYAGSNTPAKAARENAEAILAAGLDVRYVCFAHFQAVHNVDLALLRRSGCRAIFLGLESASPRILADVMHKHVRLPEAMDLLQRMRAEGIVSVASVIHPAPFEDADSRSRTLEFLLEARPDSVPVQFPGLIPGTRWQRQAKRYGFAFPGGLAKARRKGLTYKIKLLYPPRFWPKLPYTLNGKTSRELAAQTGQFIGTLEGHGLLTGVGHDLALMAGEIGWDLRDFRDHCREVFLSGDVDRAGELADRINAALCRPTAAAAAPGPIGQARKPWPGASRTPATQEG